MSAEEIYRDKQRFIAEAEKSLRRRLTEVERQMLALIFERIIERLDVKNSAIERSAANQRLVHNLGRIHREFTRPQSIKVVAAFARDVMTIPERSERYFNAISEGMADKLASVRKISDGLLRARLGLTSDMDLESGGYLQNVIEDVSVRNKLQGIMSQAIADGADVAGLRQKIREYLIGKEEDPGGALSRQADRQLFDAFMDADRSTDLGNADALGLMGAMYAGGIIETTRPLCCELNARVWTRDEMEALNAEAEAGKKWSGWKGDIVLYCGGHSCRHGWNWISNARLLRLRPDLEFAADGKSIRYKPGVARQGFNSGCRKHAA